MTETSLDAQALAKAWLEHAGWSIEGRVPDVKKFVLIAAPQREASAQEPAIEESFELFPGVLGQPSAWVR